jgi:hypothetical protein
VIRKILETYSNSASKNTTETDIFPHGPKSLLTSVIGRFVIQRSAVYFCVIFIMLYCYEVYAVLLHCI